MASGAGEGMGEETFSRGRVPLRVRIGVTGHRDLQDTPHLRSVIRAQVVRIHDALGRPANPVGSAETPVRLAVVSQLAEGGDRLVVEEVFAEARERGEAARLEVI